ncbi:MAG: hypothetical protein QGF12_07185, partial [SAR202 cluster bacterium]|nr:hypothetical protein [SAR202 cluster bacterium]
MSTSMDSIYPTLLRRGHKYLHCLGQRNGFFGVFGATDVASGSDKWIYILNRYETLTTTRIRYVPMTVEGDLGTMLHPKVDGEVERHGSEKFPSAVMC